MQFPGEGGSHMINQGESTPFFFTATDDVITWEEEELSNHHLFLI